MSYPFINLVGKTLCVWYSLGEWGQEGVWLGGSSVLSDGRSQEDAPMLTELCSSDWVVQLLSDGGTALQKLAEEQMLCLGPAKKQMSLEI